jgi:hypothetical protein
MKQETIHTNGNAPAPGATVEEIVARYKQMIAELPPDLNGRQKVCCEEQGGNVYVSIVSTFKIASP